MFAPLNSRRASAERAAGEHYATEFALLRKIGGMPTVWAGHSRHRVGGPIEWLVNAFDKDAAGNYRGHCASQPQLFSKFDRADTRVACSRIDAR
jgi:hypothetical protein